MFTQKAELSDCVPPEVGGLYLTRGGRLVMITRMQIGSVYPYVGLLIGKEGCIHTVCWTRSGNYSSVVKSKWDLLRKLN